MPFFWDDPAVRSADLRDRFPNNTVGVDAWRTLIDDLRQQRPDPHRAFDEFLKGLTRMPPSKTCRVFISHRRIDGPIALKIAQIATTKNFDYWLDVHDPHLALVTGASITSPFKEIMIAAIIEIALLNSTHVIATHTANSTGSKWIPYELGRAKGRHVVSTQAAGWFAPTFSPANSGEYTFLAMETYTQPDIEAWLQAERLRMRCSTSSVAWQSDVYGDPPDLPGPTTPDLLAKP